MLNIKCFECNILQEDCYVVSDENKECIIIDCGAFYEKEQKAIAQHIEAQGLKLADPVATYGHVDHHFGDQFVYEEYGLKVEAHQADAFLIQLLQEQARASVGVKLPDGFPSVDQYLSSDDTISFGSHQFILIGTPGHTPGSVFFYCREEDVVFSGDTLFHLSIGRTDLQGGSMLQMTQSLRMLSQLPDNTRIYLGRGEPTTIGTELAGDPYVDRQNGYAMTTLQQQQIKEKVILGIDPGTNVMGYGVIKILERKPSMVATGVIDIRKTDDPYLRLGHIFDHTTGIIDEYLPSETAIEAPFSGRNVQSILKLGRAQGAAIAAAIYHDVPVHEYAPLEIKMAITGQGQTSREQVAGMLQRLLKINQSKMPHLMDTTDALGAAYCHFLQTGRSSVDNKYHGWKDFINKDKNRLSYPSTK